MQKIQIRLTLKITAAMVLLNLSYPCCAREINDGPERPRNDQNKIYAESNCPECEIFDGKNCVPDPRKQLPPNTPSTGTECCGGKPVPVGFMCCEGQIYDQRMKNCCPGENKPLGPPDCCDPCKEAEDLGFFKPNSSGEARVGAVICCHGKKYICLLPKNAPENLNSRAKEDYMDCVLKHEEEHFYDPEMTCPSAGSYKKVTEILATREHHNKAEWQAYSNSIDCLQSKIEKLQKELDEQFCLSKRLSQKHLEKLKDDVKSIRDTIYAQKK